MDLLKQLFAYLVFPLHYLTQPGTQSYLPTYLGAGLFALVAYHIIKRRWRIGLRSAISVLITKRIAEHTSTRLDIKLVFVSLYYLMLQVLVLGGTTLFTVPQAVSALNHAIGTPAANTAPNWPITLATMLLVFLAVELGYWLAHFMMHKIPILWEFHKVHHSAEVLSPLTEWRQHPLEQALFPFLIGLTASAVQAPIVWWFGEQSLVISPTSSNLLSLAFWYTLLHLRHSELPFYATGLLGHIIQAPAHHQVHHSTNPIHFDKNLGYCLSIFDWLFGTLYIPKKGEKFKFGLGAKDEELETLAGSIMAPITRAAGMAAKAVSRKANSAPR